MNKKLFLAFICTSLSVGAVTSIGNNLKTAKAVDDNTTETSINHLMVFNDHYLMFDLSVSSTYSKTLITTETPDVLVRQFLTSSNIDSHIKINGNTNAFLNYTVIENGRIGTAMTSDYWEGVANEVTILAGTKFPTYEYLTTGVESYYVTSSDITFYRDSGDYFYSVEDTKVTSFSENNKTEANSFFTFGLTNHDYGTACENFRLGSELNYFGFNNNEFSSHIPLREYIYLDDNTSHMNQDFVGEWFSNQFGISNSFSFRKRGNQVAGCTFDKITIKAGACFPSREFFKGNSPVYKCYRVSEDVSFEKMSNGDFSKVTNILELETSVSKIETGESFLIMYLTNHDYPSTASTKFISAGNSTIEERNRLDESTAGKWRSVLIDGVLKTAGANDAIINIWDRKPTFSFYPVSGAGDVCGANTTITIPKGYRFPSYEYVVNGIGEVRAYVLKEAITFEIHDGKWYKQGEYVEPTYNNTDVTGVKTEAYNFPVEKYTWIHFDLTNFEGSSSFTTLDSAHWGVPSNCNQDTHILINDHNVSFQKYAFGYSYMGNNKTYSLRIGEYIPFDILKITIKAGLKIPTYNYAALDMDPSYYVVEHDVSFYLYNNEKSPTDYNNNGCVLSHYGSETFANSVNTLRNAINAINLENYREKDRTSIRDRLEELLMMLEGVRENESAASTIESLTNEFNTFMSGFKTISEYEILYTYAEEEIQKIIDAIDTSDYEEEAYQVILAFIEEAREQYRECENKEEIDSLLNTLKEKIASVITKSQIAELNAKIQEAISEISNYKSDEIYRNNEKSLREEIIANAIDQLHSVQSIAQIESILETAKAAIDELKTDAQYKKEEAQEYIEEKLKYLDSYLYTIDQDWYLEEDLNIIRALIEQAKIDVRNANSIEEVDEILRNFETAVSNVPCTDPNAGIIDDTSENEDIKNNGCKGNISSTLLLVSIISLTGLCFFGLKKKYN